MMKRVMKRALSMVLTLCMVLSLVALPGVITANAEGAEAFCGRQLYYNSMDAKNYNSNGDEKWFNGSKDAPVGFDNYDRALPVG